MNRISSFAGMDTIRAIIVDDEASARENLSLLVNRFCPQIEVLGCFNLLHKAVQFLKQNEVDVVFLDVEMPENAGYEIVDYFDEINFDIVFCTAYDKYAIKAFELSAIDYLLKPVEIDRLKQAAQKLQERQLHRMSMEQIGQINSSFRNTLKLMDKGERVFVKKTNIIAIEGQAAYSKIYTTERSFTASKNMAQLEEEFAEDSFFYRVQKSWLINLNCIEKVNKSERTVLLTSGIEARVSRQKARDFYSLLNL
ncbi:LytR/AlgR family response regulator transcription factor [Owenweeksia hongkongensis]|uniref:Response regulator of the LytR/AlgR family n=1 Tax=Owenweeksia hongkongensis (strain DSM 17368 / CIP 108786 / JCM 12287 / NRRL B-23963 / UST20020801) TaxID=926562 RepID=G8R3Y0_OWEHD|nr:LytTR family DNA-binding domain-containing protein [Owenweeksia hongkongensis]AEV32012.1 response regulator of the LytR/AlgR family [Owenweeksia hongkongensis DSM 17368]